MKTVDLSRIIASKPANKGVAMAMSGGAHFDDTVGMSPGQRHFEAPCPLVDPCDYPVAPSFADLRGYRMGRVIVIGLTTGITSSGGKALWLVRCECGDYEVRTSKAIKANACPDHCCGECSYNRKIKRIGAAQ